MLGRGKEGRSLWGHGLGSWEGSLTGQRQVHGSLFGSSPPAATEHGGLLKARGFCTSCKGRLESHRQVDDGHLKTWDLRTSRLAFRKAVQSESRAQQRQLERSRTVFTCLAPKMWTTTPMWGLQTSCGHGRLCCFGGAISGPHHRGGAFPEQTECSVSLRFVKDACLRFWDLRHQTHPASGIRS